MGNGASTKEQTIIKPITIFSLLENLLNQFEASLTELASAQFTSVDELSKLEINETIEKLQNKINDELINLRSKIKQIPNKIEYDNKNSKFLIFSQKSQNLYIQKEEILKSKIDYIE